MAKTDPSVHIKKTVWMQRVVDQVRHGATWYIDGECDLSRLADLHDKFDRIYDHSILKMQASRRRKEGLSTARFYSLLQSNGKIKWILVRTDGELSTLAKELKEKWRDAKTDRVSIDKFEACQITKPGLSKPAWTWKFKKSEVDLIRNLMVGYIRTKKDQELQLLLAGISFSPRFSGVRNDLKKLRELYLAEWARSRKGSDVQPIFPEIVGYVRKLPDKTERVSVLLKNQNRENGAKNV